MNLQKLSTQRSVQILAWFVSVVALCLAVPLCVLIGVVAKLTRQPAAPTSRCPERWQRFTFDERMMATYEYRSTKW